MPFEVVHAVSGYVQVAGESFCKACAHEERSHEAWTRGISDGVDVLEFDAGFFYGGFGDGGNFLQVSAGGNFGNDSSVECVFVDLAVERVRQDLERVVL